MSFRTVMTAPKRNHNPLPHPPILDASALTATAKKALYN